MTTTTGNPTAEKAAAYLNDPALLDGGMGWLREHYPDLSADGLLDHGWTRGSICREGVKTALGFLLECRAALSPRHHTYTLKHTFEDWTGLYVANGELIGACLLAGVRVSSPPDVWHDAYVHLLAPKDCKDRCGNRIPAGDRHLICDQCRAVPGRR